MITGWGTVASSLIMRDVLGFSARETAEALGTTSVAINSALQRAHATIDRVLPVRGHHRHLGTVSEDHIREVVGRYMEAVESADVPAVVALLADEVVLSMPPLPEWYVGRDAVRAYYETRTLGNSRRRPATLASAR